MLSYFLFNIKILTNWVLSFILIFSIVFIELRKHCMFYFRTLNVFGKNIKCFR